MIQIDYCGDKRWIEEKDLPKYQEALNWIMKKTKENGTNPEEIKDLYYLKILKGEK